MNEVEEKKIVQEEYEKNPRFKQWFDAYHTYTGLSQDILWEHPTVIYSAKYWRNARENLVKG